MRKNGGAVYFRVFGEPVASYDHGEIIYHTDDTSFLIETTGSAHGGWSAMDYIIARKGDKQKTNNSIRVDYFLAEQILKDVLDSLNSKEDKLITQEKIRVRINEMFDVDIENDWIDNYTFYDFPTGIQLDSILKNQINEIYILTHKKKEENNGG